MLLVKVALLRVYSVILKLGIKCICVIKILENMVDVDPTTMSLTCESFPFSEQPIN